MKFLFFISKKQTLHKLEISYIFLWVLKGNKIPSRVLHKEFWTKAMNIFNRCIPPSPQNKKKNFIFHMWLFLILKLCVFEKMHYIFYKGKFIRPREGRIYHANDLNFRAPHGSGPLSRPLYKFSFSISFLFLKEGALNCISLSFAQTCIYSKSNLM